MADFTLESIGQDPVLARQIEVLRDPEILEQFRRISGEADVATFGKVEALLREAGQPEAPVIFWNSAASSEEADQFLQSQEFRNIDPAKPRVIVFYDFPEDRNPAGGTEEAQESEEPEEDWEAEGESDEEAEDKFEGGFGEVRILSADGKLEVTVTGCEFLYFHPRLAEIGEEGLGLSIDEHFGAGSLTTDLAIYNNRGTLEVTKQLRDFDDPEQDFPAETNVYDLPAALRT